MRIVIHDYGAYAFSAQLARALSGRGHEVTYLHSIGMNTPRGRLTDADRATGDLEVHGIELAGFRRAAGVRRLVVERRYGHALADAITQRRPGVVISANCPLDPQARALRATHAAGGAFVHWCQDVYSLAVQRLLQRRSGPVGRLVGARFRRIEREIVGRSDAVVVISDDFRPIVEPWRGGKRAMHVIPNWAPLDEIFPMPHDNPWSRRHGVTGSVALLYAGTLGRKHDPTLLVTLAEAAPEATVLVASEGAGTERLRGMALPANLRLLPMQPAEDVPAMLAAADVLIALLEHDAQIFSVPSKVLTYLAAGRPILAALPAENLAARTTEEADAGLVVEPADREAIAAAARSLLTDADRRNRLGAAGRRYAEGAFDIEQITDRFEAVLSDAANRSMHRA